MFEVWVLDVNNVFYARNYALRYGNAVAAHGVARRENLRLRGRRFADFKRRYALEKRLVFDLQKSEVALVVYGFDFGGEGLAVLVALHAYVGGVGYVVGVCKDCVAAYYNPAAAVARLRQIAPGRKKVGLARYCGNFYNRAQRIALGLRE